LAKRLDLGSGVCRFDSDQGYFRKKSGFQTCENCRFYENNLTVQQTKNLLQCLGDAIRQTSFFQKEGSVGSSPTLSTKGVRMLAVIIHGYYVEVIYFAAFMLACLGAMLLGKWTTKNLLLFMFWIAVVVALTNAAISICRNMPVNNTTNSSGTPV